ncbi:hypothetical protein [Streptococcus uberis]|uniref:hypothetical protein n=1 Tax=Streptococcus uberis TaxID=1349 RepID=UPI000620453D|nr:hypothetical protein [Streptococcus uberis]KKF57314.1 hypothetical protein AF69_05905 [Streptococcus uberis 6736]QBX21915.1 hypothetical protein Javan617_0020 [Streptococcus phage Javan617]
MTIKEELLKNEVISKEDIDFLISVTPQISQSLEKDYTDDIFVDFVDELQDLSVIMISESSKDSWKYDDIVNEISGY